MLAQHVLHEAEKNLITVNESWVHTMGLTTFIPRNGRDTTLHLVLDDGYFYADVGEIFFDRESNHWTYWFEMPRSLVAMRGTHTIVTNSGQKFRIFSNTKAVH